MNLNLRIPKISNQIYAEKTLSVLVDNYAAIVPQWAVTQLEWLNTIYKGFKDHDRFLIIMYLTKKTLDFYFRNFTRLTYDDFYSKDIVEIEKFNVNEVAKETNIPKESVRRKILELNKEGIILYNKNKIFINRSAYLFIKPINSIKRMSRFLSKFSTMLANEKILSKPLNSEDLEKLIKKNFSYVWKFYYEFQIPMIKSYKKIFIDMESFTIFGTCAVNQHLNNQKMNENKMNRREFLESLNSYSGHLGLNAMSISEITGIPRATVVRKLKKLIKIKMVSIDKKKHYKISNLSIKKSEPIQKELLSNLTIFSTLIYNLSIL